MIEIIRDRFLVPPSTEKEYNFEKVKITKDVFSKETKDNFVVTTGQYGQCLAIDQ